MSKYSMIEVVREQFKNNLALELKRKRENKPSLKLPIESECRNESKLCLERKLPTRVFDSFPCLITETTLNEFTKKFESLINSVILFELFNDNLELEIETGIKFKDYLKEITIIGREQIMNQNGLLSDEISNEYGWDEYQKQFHVGDFICAFIGRVFQSLIKAPAIDKLIKSDNTNALSSIFDFINKNYGLLVGEHLKQFNINYTPTALPSIVKRITRIPKEHPTATATAFGVLTIGVGMMVATLFAMTNNNSINNNKTSSPKPTP